MSITQSGGGIYRHTSIANQVTFRWVATNTANNSAVNFAVTLYKTGGVQFYYGSGNTNLAPTIGMSAGNSIAYQLFTGYSGQASLDNAASVLYTCSRASSIWRVRIHRLQPRHDAADDHNVSPAVVAAGGSGFSIGQVQVTFSKPVTPSMPARRPPTNCARPAATASAAPMTSSTA